MAIQSFRGTLTEKIFLGVRDKEVHRFPANLLKIAERKLDMVNAAAVLNDLASPPGNNLHALKNDLTGCHSIRINDQWRVIFRWEFDGPHEVEIRDYH